MFTRIAKVMLVLSVIAVVILSICVGIDKEGFGWFLLTFMVGFLVLTMFGMFIELANNVMDIKVYLERKAYSTVSNTVNTNSNQMSTDDLMNKLTNTKKLSEEQTVNKNTTWNCKRCGIKNESIALFCSNCGQWK